MPIKTATPGTALATVDESALVSVESAPRQMQDIVEALLQASCCKPALTALRSYAGIGSDVTWEAEVAHAMIAYDESGHPQRHGKRTVFTISTFGG